MQRPIENNFNYAETVIQDCKNYIAALNNYVDYLEAKSEKGIILNGSNALEIIILGEDFNKIFWVYISDVELTRGKYKGYFKAAVKKTLDKILLNKPCFIKVKYPTGKTFGGHGHIEEITDTHFTVLSH